MSAFNPTRRILEDVTAKSFAVNAYVSVDDEWIVQGKYCRCAYVGNNRWDVWVCNPSDIASGLSQRKVSAIVSRIAEITPCTGTFHELTGEGYYPTMSTEALLQSMAPLGIFKRRKSVPGVASRLPGRKAKAQTAESATGIEA